MVARGVVYRELGRRGAIMKMISGHEPGHELTPADACDAQNRASGAH
jgi:hypothetical protein